MPLVTETATTPDGAFTIVVSATGVLASGWTQDEHELRQLIHPRVLKAAIDDDAPASHDAAKAMAQQAIGAVQAYYGGDVDAVRHIPVHQAGSLLRTTAWETLRAVRGGNPISYKEFAHRSGSPTAVRAAAGACASNAAALFVPCHRVVRSDGSLGGFRYGLPIKEALLRREASFNN